MECCKQITKSVDLFVDGVFKKKINTCSVPVFNLVTRWLHPHSRKPLCGLRDMKCQLRLGVNDDP